MKPQLFEGYSKAMEKLSEIPYENLNRPILYSSNISIEGIIETLLKKDTDYVEEKRKFLEGLNILKKKGY